MDADSVAKAHRLIDALDTTLPGLPALVLKAREAVVRAMGEDTPDRTLDTLKKLVVLLANQPLDVLSDRVSHYREEAKTRVSVTNPVIKQMIENSCNELDSVNRVAMQVRRSMDEFDALRAKVRGAKESVVTEFREAMCQFREMVDLDELSDEDDTDSEDDSSDEDETDSEDDSDSFESKEEEDEEATVEDTDELVSGTPNTHVNGLGDLIHDVVREQMDAFREEMRRLYTPPPPILPVAGADISASGTLNSPAPYPLLRQPHFSHEQIRAYFREPSADFVVDGLGVMRGMETVMENFEERVEAVDSTEAIERSMEALALSDDGLSETTLPENENTDV
jgi:hypothetical protein